MLVAEPEGAAHSDPDLAAALLRDAITTALAELHEGEVVLDLG